MLNRHNMENNANATLLEAPFTYKNIFEQAEKRHNRNTCFKKSLKILFFLKVASQGLLWFHMNFRMVLFLHKMPMKF